MIISDISVRRPVFAAVISLVLVILGLLSIDRLSVREYPDVNPPVIAVKTFYRGASAEVIERRVTQLLEDELAGIAGVVTGIGAAVPWLGAAVGGWVGYNQAEKKAKLYGYKYTK